MAQEDIYSLLEKIQKRQKLNAKWYVILGLMVAFIGGLFTYFSNYTLTFGNVLIGLGVGYASYGRILKQNNEIGKIMELVKNLN